MVTCCQVQEAILALPGLYIPDATGLPFSLISSSTKILLSDHWAISLWRGIFLECYGGSQKKTEDNIIGIYDWLIIRAYP